MAKGVRGGEDNVIYANFGAKRRVYTAAETGLPQIEVTAASLSPAAMRILNAAVRQTDVARAKRGHAYAAHGHVMDLRFRTGGVEGRVAGSQNEPFVAGLLLPRRTPEELRAAVRELALMPGGQVRADRGDFPDPFLDVMLGAKANEVHFYCDCPDSSRVCKHAVALAEVVAGRVDKQPSLVFAMRDLNSRVVEETLRRGAHALAAENAEKGSPYFWSGRDLPELPNPKVAPMIDDSDLQLLRTAMGTVSFTNIDQMFAVSDIEKLYDMLIDGQ
ncbi:hypothetical protein JZY91_04095 [Corynebacterium sp. CNCTC7651]|uniref:SWIM zinc finger family protein n=1 Tax=Corynebacterium sp. CNCTC7651 TaxID=2815361 RepID=UPI001F424C58|nr:hypothetical protein [Corynebacterium sp. CNCTC7651]UIZ92932.1 hypothetical protein JZY91_04095 [Corynebacterium sp. CNCTC7651]